MSTRFDVVGKDEYQLSKMSDACAAGTPSLTLDYIRQEAIRFCAARKQVPLELEATTEYGIPVIRCASATLRFQCH